MGKHAGIKVTLQQYIFLADKTHEQRIGRILSPASERMLKAEFHKLTNSSLSSTRLTLTDTNHEFGGRKADGSFYKWSVDEMGSILRNAGWSPRYDNSVSEDSE